VHVRGYALDPPSEPNLFHLAYFGEVLDNDRGDIRDYPRLEASLTDFASEERIATKLAAI
jgi:CDP-glucose 4,6-dehydratase